VEDVLKTEPSYYSWMMQGDFPLYTKRKLEEIYNRWTAKKVAERQPKPVAPKPAEQPVAEIAAVAPGHDKAAPPAAPETKAKDVHGKREFHKPQAPSNNYPPRHENKAFTKKDEGPALPVNDDMLKQLADKFKKG
jgi:DNA polymerase-3 subunit epsilon